ncbi:MAG: efflux RND transporter periplasmic adaptor subunit [Ignavibacteriales bacterium]|nr:efflux RND transporter periplasmic adaptor subunit [Ignavibacteriales bacterium]
MKTTTILFFATFIFFLEGCNNKHGDALESTGTLESVDVNVSAKTSGQLQKLFVDEGSNVKVNDTLAILDHATLDLQLAQAEAGIELAKSQYDLIMNGARSEDIRQAEEMQTQAETNLKSASDDLNRMKELFASKSITKKQLDDAETRFTIAQTQFNSAKQNYEKLKKFARPEDISTAKARVSQAEATANLLRKQISDAVILAPTSGTITHKPIEVGELVGVGTVVVTISRLEKLNLKIYLSETELGKVKLGSVADVTIDAFPDKNFPAKVMYISPNAEFTPKNIQTKEDRTKLVFAVKLEVDNPNSELKSGMPADAFIK